MEEHVMLVYAQREVGTDYRLTFNTKPGLTDWLCVMYGGFSLPGEIFYLKGSKVFFSPCENHLWKLLFQAMPIKWIGWLSADILIFMSG